MKKREFDLNSYLLGGLIAATMYGLFHPFMLSRFGILRYIFIGFICLSLLPIIIIPYLKSPEKWRPVFMSFFVSYSIISLAFGAISLINMTLSLQIDVYVIYMMARSIVLSGLFGFYSYLLDFFCELKRRSHDIK